MRVLVVKLTSMGDVLHVMPALSDLKAQYPDLSVDWMVEDSFAQIPDWHPSVNQVIPVATRRWRTFRWTHLGEFLAFWKQLRRQRYDAVIDAQGLIKSAVFSRFARINKNGKRIGFSADSIKESPAAKFYHQKVDVDRQLHAIDRLRILFAQGFGYAKTKPQQTSQSLSKPNYGLKPSATSSRDLPTIFLLHGTTWATKHLPDEFWRKLTALIIDDGYRVMLCWGNDVERKRAEWIADSHSHAEVLPKSSLSELKKKMSVASGAVAVDTGLGHLAAALALPCVSIYGSTNAELTGAVGENQTWVQSAYPCSPCLHKTCSKLTDQVIEPPCYQEVDPATIWQTLYEKIA